MDGHIGPLIQVGGNVDKQTLSQLSASIIQILKSPGDQKTIRHALSVIGDAVTVQHATISNCSLIGNRVTHNGDPT